MNYDFDMHSVLPLAAQRKARSEGRKGDLSGQQIALFRDPKVADALRAADREVQELFLESGFGLTSWVSDLPQGRFRAIDEEARTEAISRFAANLRASRGRLRKANWGGFSISDFTNSYLNADALPQPMGLLARDRDDGADPDVSAELASPEMLARRARARLRRRHRGNWRRSPLHAASRFLDLSPLQKVCALGVVIVAWLLALTIWHVMDNGLGIELARAMTRITGGPVGF
ncbi:hypothetical protein [Pseudooceanicola sp. 200-1SW]|uniref:hypothetical protein n=1 Tax=Pseudooceanicola sp. 200-1SW TaxID=3425949 RepID=UPI003D7F63E2